MALAVPTGGVLVATVLGGRHAHRVALTVLATSLALAVLIARHLLETGEPLVYLVGGWAPPLGIALRADGLSATMLLMSAVVLLPTALYALQLLPAPQDGGETRVGFAFWILLIGVAGALNAVFVGHDLFNLYVALELATFAAVPLVCLQGTPAVLAAALRYLLFALLGSVLYLLGAVLLYGAYGTLDIGLLAARVQPQPTAWLAGALMTVGLLAKTALFPFHLWLPAAHSGALPPASAVLSALVVKGSFLLVVRIWFDVLPAVPLELVAQILAALGALAIFVGGAMALAQRRLKLLVAYSTVAQIGYLFLMFPLLMQPEESEAVRTGAWLGGALQASSHACAKAAMFLAVGLFATRLGHDRIARLGGLGRALPVPLLAFGLAGMSLIGLPPSGGFVAKWLLLTAALDSGQWLWAVVIGAGGLLTGAYIFRVLVVALADRRAGLPPGPAVPVVAQAMVLVLASASLLLGLIPFASLGLLEIGRSLPATGVGELP
jgi:formate hydrogenlyase subunit 3/multisubunit Na+/H+ antiporter MnhD subunit